LVAERVAAFAATGAALATVAELRALAAGAATLVTADLVAAVLVVVVLEGVEDFLVTRRFPWIPGTWIPGMDSRKISGKKSAGDLSKP
jgi:hypothetical protein